MKKLFTYIILAITALSLSSCYFEDRQLFEESAAQRLDKATAETKELLESSSNGWWLEYYLGSDYTYGGFNFLLKFEDGKVSVSGDVAGDPTWVETSSYGIVRDQGIVISFDTYNEIFHYLCQPYQDQVNGFEGDFELVVLSMENDKIEVKGKKWGNHMTLTRMPENKTWEETLGSIANISDNIFYTYYGEFDKKNIMVELDDNYHITMYWDDENSEEEAYEPFIFTETGLKTRTPFEFGGYTFQNFIYNGDNTTLTSLENPSFSISAELPEGYKTFKEVDAIIKGQFKMSWFNGNYSKDVTITSNETGAKSDSPIISIGIPNNSIAPFTNAKQVRWNPHTESVLVDMKLTAARPPNIRDT